MRMSKYLSAFMCLNKKRPCNLPGLYSANYVLLWSCLDVSEFGQVFLFNFIE